ncbi:hypothetical protein Tco_1540438 [Tanacetum coccineum]
MQEPSESTPTISLQLPSQVKSQGLKDKGKEKMIEPEKPLKKKDEIKFDEGEALRLPSKFDRKKMIGHCKGEKLTSSRTTGDCDNDEEKSTLFQTTLGKKRRKYSLGSKKSRKKRGNEGHLQDCSTKEQFTCVLTEDKKDGSPKT